MDYRMDRLPRHDEAMLLEELRRLAKELGRAPTKKDIAQHGRAGYKPYKRVFGSLANARHCAGLERGLERWIPDDDLLEELGRLWDEVGRRPEAREMVARGKYSAKPYLARWGTWLNACEAFVKSRNLPEKNTELPTQSVQGRAERWIRPLGERRRKRAQYGEPIDFRGLRHAPINEQGVVYLFGVVSRELGFVVEAVRSEYPDCEAKRQVPGQPGIWESARIEFEFKSSRFRTHVDAIDDCDVIVCWDHDWPECPMEVISLKDVVARMATQT